jgi:hypothetical protein
MPPFILIYGTSVKNCMFALAKRLSQDTLRYSQPIIDAE